jgi:uncharacterized protein (TIGR02246 family)
MKRTIVAAMLMLFAVPVALGQATNGKPGSANAGASSVADMLIAKERQVVDALMKKDAKTFNSLVAGDGILNGSQGRTVVADFTKMMFGPDYSLSNSTVEDPQVTMIDKDAAILTYKSTGTETMQGHTQTATSYATTIWVKRKGDWKAVFHQESMVAPTAATSAAQ